MFEHRNSDPSPKDDQYFHTSEKDSNLHYSQILSMESTPASSPRPTSSRYDLTDDRAAQIREAFCQRIISKQKISKKDHDLFIALLSSQIPSEEYLREKEGSLRHLIALDQVFTTIKMFIDRAWEMTQEYELVLWNETTNLRGQNYLIALSLNENSVIQYSTSAMVQGQDFLGTLEDQSLTTDEYSALITAISIKQIKSLNNDTRLKLTEVLRNKYHLLALDRAHYFTNHLSSDFVSAFKQAIQVFFPDESNLISEDLGLTKAAVSTFEKLYVTIQEFDPEYQKNIVEELAKHGNALQNLQTLEVIQAYLIEQKKNINKLILDKGSEIDEAMPAYEDQVRNRSETLNNLRESTPFKEPSNNSSESPMTFSNNNNFDTPAKEASRKTMQHIRDNQDDQEKLFNANPGEKTNEKQRLLNTLLGKEALSPDQIHTSAWLIANGAKLEEKFLKKSKLELYTFLRMEERMLREEEARSGWIQQVNAALLEVTQYVNEEINKLDKKNSSNTNPNIQSEKTNLNAKLEAIHQAVKDINQGKSVRQTLDSLQKNTVLAERRSFFSAKTLKKVKEITLKLAPSVPVVIEENGIKGLAKACLAVRQEKLKKINERKEKTKLAVALLESVKAHIQTKLESIFTIDKKTLRNRLSAIEAAQEELRNLNNHPEPENNHAAYRQNSGEISLFTIGSATPHPKTEKDILEELKDQECVKKPRICSLFGSPETRKSIAAITTITCAAAA